MSRYSIIARSVAELLSDIAVLHVSGESVVVSGLSQDSRNVQPGDMYFCVRGEHFDGHHFIKDALARGATSVVIDSDIDPLPETVSVVRVNDVRSVIGEIAASACGHPATQLITVGITGTNGKTTTAAMLASILKHDGAAVATIGTLTHSLTTPEALDLQFLLADYVSQKMTHVVMEVSSHALAQDRVRGITFDVAVFTNMSRDHLDFHGTPEAYFAAKAKLFSPQQSLRGVVNIDDPQGLLLCDAQPIPISSFSMSDVSDVHVEIDEVECVWSGHRLHVPMGGTFTVMNAIAAATTARALGVSTQHIVDGLSQMPVVAGRFEAIANQQGIGVVVDFAHTPEGLRQVLQSARVATNCQLIVVFGCGGDRDKGKRPEMGKVAAELADVVVVTSDNPRSESPTQIIAEILAGIPTWPSHQIEAIQDRAEAITSAILRAEHGDIVVIAGKGHEATQETHGVRAPFSDVEQAKSALMKKGGALQ